MNNFEFPTVPVLGRGGGRWGGEGSVFSVVGGEGTQNSCIKTNPWPFLEVQSCDIKRNFAIENNILYREDNDTTEALHLTL